MQEVHALGLQAMQQDMQRLDRISTNMANALTPGYKREVMSSQPLRSNIAPFSMLVEQLDAAGLGATGTTSSFLPLMVQTDVKTGTLKSTGQSLDLALAGSGFFEVSTDTGPAYTRQGSFHVDARGRLVNAQGHAVMGKGGEIYLNGASPVIDSVGNVFDSAAVTGMNGAAGKLGSVPLPNGLSNSPVAQIKVVQFEDAKSLQRLGDGLFAGSENNSVLKETDIQIRQGFIENSNVNSLQEMVQLIQTMRHFESMQKVLLGYDDMTGQAVRKLGELL